MFRFAAMARALDGGLLSAVAVAFAVSAVAHAAPSAPDDLTKAPNCAPDRRVVTDHIDLCLEATDDPELVAEWAGWLESFHVALSDYLGLSPAGPLTVRVRLSREDAYEDLRHAGVPYWGDEAVGYFYFRPSGSTAVLIGTDRLQRRLGDQIVRLFLFEGVGTGKGEPEWFQSGFLSVLGRSRRENGAWCVGPLLPLSLTQQFRLGFFERLFPGGLLELVSSEEYSGIMSWAAVFWMFVEGGPVAVFEFGQRARKMPASDAWELTFGPIDADREREFKQFLRSLALRKAQKRWRCGLHRYEESAGRGSRVPIGQSVPSATTRSLSTFCQRPASE